MKDRVHGLTRRIEVSLWPWGGQGIRPSVDGLRKVQRNNRIEVVLCTKKTSTYHANRIETVLRPGSGKREFGGLEVKEERHEAENSYAENEKGLSCLVLRSVLRISLKA